MHCGYQDDPGTSGRFTTFIKARIFCEREVPPGRQFVGTIDYQYNEISKYILYTVNCHYAILLYWQLAWSLMMTVATMKMDFGPR